MHREDVMSRLTTGLVLVIAGAIMLQNFLTVRVLRQVEALSTLITAGGGRIEGSVGGPQAGQEAPSFAHADTGERTWSKADLLGRPALLVFSSPTCKFCTQLYPELRRLSEDDAARELQILVLQLGASPDENLRLKQEQGFGFEVLSADQESFAAYAVPGTPFSVLLDEEGRVVRTGTVNSYERLVEFVRT
jgi:methylamine dehydrogenase accessory protein MauD